MDGYTLVAFEFDVCYLFFLAEFLIDSGMSVVADQRYMKLWSELLAPVHIAPSGFISGGDPVAIMPFHNLKEVAYILVGALVLVCSLTEIGTFSCPDDASNQIFCCSSIFVGEEVHHSSAADRINL